MTDDDAPGVEEEFAGWLTAAAEALAAGTTVVIPDEHEFDPELRARMERALAGLQALQQLRQPRTAAASGATWLSGGRPEPGAAPSPPWTSLGRFLIRREVGRGAFGVVFLAHDPLLDREVALKVPHIETAFNPQLRERFHREARAASALDHPNVVPVHEVGEAGPVSFIVSAYCPGVTLAEWLKRRTEPAPFRDAAQLVAILAEAVQHAHERGVVHRDLKPANILLAPNSQSEARNPKPIQSSQERNAIPASPGLDTGSSHLGFVSDFEFRVSDFTPKVTDFGLAKLAQEAPLDGGTRSGTIVGTVSYMAPEQAAGKSKEIGPAADVYALGAILYELLTRRPPFQGETELETLRQVQTEEPLPAHRLRPRIPHDLQTICAKCLEKEAGKRYASAQALADDLRRFLAGTAIRARPVGMAERLGRWCGRNPGLATSSGLAAAALAAVVVLSITFGIRQQHAADRIRDEQARTRAAFGQVEKQHSLAQRRWALAALDQGLARCEKGETARGILWLARSLEIATDPASDDAADLQTAIRSNLASWRRELRALRHVFPHESRVLATAFSADGTIIATGSQDKTARLWHAASGQAIGPPLQHGNAVCSAAFSPDGRTLATGTREGAIHLWDARTGKSIAVGGQKGQVHALSFASDGKTILSLNAREVGQLDASTLKPIATPLKFPNAASAGALASDGTRFVTVDQDGFGQIWEVASGRPIGERLLHRGDSRTLALSPDGKLGITLSDDQTARLWLASTGDYLGPPLTHPDRVLAAAFSPDARTAVTGTADQTARLWDVTTGRPLGHSLVHQSPVHVVSIGPDGRTVLTGPSDGNVRLWDVSTGEPRADALPHPSAIQDAKFSPGGQTILTACGDHAARLWDATLCAPCQSLEQTRSVQRAALSPDGRKALTGGFAKIGQLWDVATGQPIGRPLQHDDVVHALAFSPDGRLAATAGADRAVKLWDGATGAPVGTVLWHDGAVVGVAFSPDSKTLLTGSEDQTARLWDVESGRCLGMLQHGGPLVAWSVAFSPDGRTVATAAVDKTAHVWDARTGAPVGEIMHHAEGVVSIAFSADSRTVVTGSYDNTALLWDAATGKRIGVPLQHQGAVRTVAFSPNGSRIATGSSDHTARLWETASGKPVGEPLMHRGRVRDLAFSRDGKRLVTASFDNTARVWDTATGKPIGPPLRHRNWVVSVDMTPDSTTVLTGSSDGTACLWPVPAPVQGGTERVVLWTQLLTGLEMDSDGVVRRLDSKTWLERRERLQELGGPPLD